mgnify:CR=1 FL=1
MFPLVTYLVVLGSYNFSTTLEFGNCKHKLVVCYEITCSLPSRKFAAYTHVCNKWRDETGSALTFLKTRLIDCLHFNHTLLNDLNDMTLWTLAITTVCRTKETSIEPTVHTRLDVQTAIDQTSTKQTSITSIVLHYGWCMTWVSRFTIIYLHFQERSFTGRLLYLLVYLVLSSLSWLVLISKRGNTVEHWPPSECGIRNWQGRFKTARILIPYLYLSCIPNSHSNCLWSFINCSLEIEMPKSRPGNSSTRTNKIISHLWKRENRS